MKKSWLFLTALFVSISATASIDALNFASPEQEKRLSSTKHKNCVVLNVKINNIADSNATIAVDMRAKCLSCYKEGKNEVKLSII